jgi:hypothetical protein
MMSKISIIFDFIAPVIFGLSGTPAGAWVGKFAVETSLKDEADFVFKLLLLIVSALALAAQSVPTLLHLSRSMILDSYIRL